MRVLTGIATTGAPHLGNYAGAIRPAIDMSLHAEVRSFYFLADYHAMVKIHDAQAMQQALLEVAASWLALGLDTDRSIFYRQSDIPEIMELNWLLLCVTPKGLLNRAHAYKAIVADNSKRTKQRDIDYAVTMGLYGYPVLMAADILMFNADRVPVGRDQLQHLEMTRDIAQNFNRLYGEAFVLPQAEIIEQVAVLAGLDGRKMSKSYRNTIPLFADCDQLRKLIMKIETNSLPPGAPKDTESCTLFQIYRAFATKSETAAMAARYREGIAWGEMKNELFEYIDATIAPSRIEYAKWKASPDTIYNILNNGAQRAREISVPFMAQLRTLAGIDGGKTYV